MSYLEGDSLLRDIAQSFGEGEDNDLLIEGALSGETEEDNDFPGLDNIEDKNISSKEPSAIKNKSLSSVA